MVRRIGTQFFSSVSCRRAARGDVTSKVRSFRENPEIWGNLPLFRTVFLLPTPQGSRL